MSIRLVPMRAPQSTLKAGAHCSDGWEVATPWHFHDMHQLLYAFDGSVEVEGQHGKYKVPRQFAAWIPAGAVHRTTIQKVASGSVFLSPEIVASEATSPRVITAPSILREMVMHAMRWPLDRVEDAISSAYFDCFARLCTEWIRDEVQLVLPSSSDTRIAAVLDHTRLHIATITFEEVCRRMDMSERTLRRYFRKAIGISWEDYRQRLRLSLALDRLDRTRLSIGIIAADVGYENQAAFARAFRAVMGASPSEYRRRKS